MKAYLITDDVARLDPLRRELDRLAVPAEAWPLDSASYDLGEAPPQGVFVNRVAPAAAGSPRLRALLTWLESYNRRVLNGTGAAALESSRVLQYAALRAAGIPVPRTVSVCGDNADDLKRAAREFAGPIAVIPNRPGLPGGRIFDTIEQFDAAADAGELPLDPDGVVLLQIVLGEPTGTGQITRVEFVGGVVQSAARLTVYGPARPEAPVIDAAERLDGFDNAVLDRALVFLYSHRVDIGALELADDGRGGLLAVAIGGAAEPTRDTSPRTLAATASLIAHELNLARSAAKGRPAASPNQRELIRTAV